MTSTDNVEVQKRLLHYKIIENVVRINMKQIAGYINIYVGFWFSTGLAVMASLTTFTQLYRRKSRNTREAVKESVKDGIWFFIVAFICLISIILLIQRMF